MIFLLSDYRNYLRKTGRYARHYRNFMGGAFQGRIPDEKIDAMKPGDLLFVQTLGSRLSWLIMYLTSSEVSHFAAYAGDRRIVHATTNAGVIEEPIEALFDENTRVLVAQLEGTSIARKDVAESKKKILGAPYGHDVVRYKAYQILFGRDWRHFKWKFAADLILTLLLIDLPIVLVLGSPVISWLVPVYLLVLAFNALLWRFLPPKPSERTVKPNDMISYVMSSGATLLYDEEFLGAQVRTDIDALQQYARLRSRKGQGETG